MKRVIIDPRGQAGRACTFLAFVQLGDNIACNSFLLLQAGNRPSGVLLFSQQSVPQMVLSNDIFV